MRRLPAVAAIALLAALTAGALLASPAGPGAAAGADRIVADLGGVDPGATDGPASGEFPDGGTHAARQRSASVDGTGRSGSDPDASGRNASATNETASPDPAAVRDALIGGERLVAPCAAEPPGWHVPANASGRLANRTEDWNWTRTGYWRTENRTLVRNASGPPANASVVGRVDGTWYDARLSISDPENATANVSERALERLVERTAARVEALRCLDFESVPRVQVVDRSTMVARQRTELSERGPDRERFDDARLEAALLVPTEVDSTAARLRARSGAVRAAYDPEDDVVTLLGPDDGNGTVDAAALDESTLAHELVHALQDQHFDLARFDSRRTDRALAEGALVEGGATVVERWYRSRCGSGGWTEACLDATPPSSPGASPDPGLHLHLYQPYNDGPGFVERTFERDGWSAVDALYAEPPESAAEVLFPTAYENYEREQLSVQVTAGRGWELLRPDGGPTTDSLGPATVAATLMSPTFESGTDPIYPPQTLQQTGTRVGLDRYQTYDYRVDAARGWAGDRLLVYRRDDEVASVWRSRWRSGDDAALFERRYAALLERRGAAPHDRLPGVYRFRDSSMFAGTVYVDADDRFVTVVHGPDLQALRALHPDVPRPSDGGRGSSEPASSRPTEVSGDALPGLTALGGLVALLLAIAVRGRAGEE